MNVCGTDFGTQKSSFCSAETFRELWLPYYKRINDWVHRNTNWKTFKHSCGAVEKFIPSFLEAGFDILNPVQCSAAGMEPERLKAAYGDRLVFWGGGVDTQQVLPFGTPAARCASRCCGAARSSRAAAASSSTPCTTSRRGTPVANLVAMFEAVREFNGA